MTAAYFLAGGNSFSSGEAVFTARRPLRPHTQDFAEVFWVEHGTGIHTINRQPQPVTAGALSLIRPGDSHGLRVTPGTGELATVSVCLLDWDFWLGNHASREAAAFWKSVPRPFTVHVDAATLAWLTEYRYEFASYWQTGYFFITKFLDELALRLQRLCSPPPARPAWLQQALIAIHEPRHFQGGARALAKLAGRSLQHVNLVLHQHCGLTATEVVNRARMEYAADQLKRGDKKIIDICLECGLNNVGHFHQVFRQQYTVTPNSYRRQHRGE